jgi:hypothetical protein
VVVSAIIFIGMGVLGRRRTVAPEVEELLDALNRDEEAPRSDRAATAPVGSK